MPRRFSVGWLMGVVVLTAFVCGLAVEQRTHNLLDDEITRGRKARENLDWHTAEATFCRFAQNQTLPYDSTRNVFRQAVEKQSGIVVDLATYHDWATEQARHEHLIRFFDAEVRNTPRRKEEARLRLIIPFW